jgi:hypothetical protein
MGQHLIKQVLIYFCKLVLMFTHGLYFSVISCKFYLSASVGAKPLVGPLVGPCVGTWLGANVEGARLGAIVVPKVVSSEAAVGVRLGAPDGDWVTKLVGAGEVGACELGAGDGAKVGLCELGAGEGAKVGPCELGVNVVMPVVRAVAVVAGQTCARSAAVAFCKSVS